MNELLFERGFMRLEMFEWWAFSLACNWFALRKFSKLYSWWIYIMASSFINELFIAKIGSCYWVKYYCSAAKLASFAGMLPKLLTLFLESCLLLSVVAKIYYTCPFAPTLTPLFYFKLLDATPVTRCPAAVAWLLPPKLLSTLIDLLCYEMDWLCPFLGGEWDPPCLLFFLSLGLWLSKKPN